MAALRFFSKNLKNFQKIHTKSQNNLNNYTPLLTTVRLKTNFTSVPGLEQFFDDEGNWGSTEVKSGRAWKAEELRLKSNEDLHKLWYVLLKERNMLLTMEEESNQENRLFPTPERRDKVEISMENIESVVRERNKAYHLLETGKSGERVIEEVIGPFGLPIEHVQEEHLIPKYLNEQWQKEHEYDNESKDVKAFLSRYREQELIKRKRQRNRDFNHVIGLLKRFPNMDMEALKEQYPDVDIEKAKLSRKCRGHFVPK